MKGNIIGQILHGSAATTHAGRTAILLSEASLAELRLALLINPKMVAKWRKYMTEDDLKAEPYVPVLGSLPWPTRQRSYPRAADYYRLGPFEQAPKRVQGGLRLSRERRQHLTTSSRIGKIDASSLARLPRLLAT